MIEKFDNNNVQQIRSWIFEAFGLPKDAKANISERQCEENNDSSAYTDITINFGDKHEHHYTISRPLADVTQEDIATLRSTDENHTRRHHTILGKILRFFVFWLGFSGLYATFAVCPVCGQAGCPVGVGSASLVGGVSAFLLQHWKASIRFLYYKLFRR